MYWLIGLLIYRIAGGLYDVLILMILPFFIGMTIFLCLKNVSLKLVLVFCGISIITRELILNARIFILFYNDSQVLNYTWQSIKAFLYIGPIQMFFSLIGPP